MCVLLTASYIFLHSELLMPFVEDEEELASAVQFLHCQSMCDSKFT